MTVKKYYSYEEVLNFFSLFDIQDLLRTGQIRIVLYYRGLMEVFAASKNYLDQNNCLNFGDIGDYYHFCGYLEYLYNEKRTTDGISIFFTYNDIFEQTTFYTNSKRKEYSDNDDIEYQDYPKDHMKDPSYTKIYGGLEQFSFVKEDVDRIKLSYYQLSNVGTATIGHATPEHYQQQRDQLLKETDNLKAEIEQLKILPNKLEKENKRLLRLIGAMLEENKQRGVRRANQEQIVESIVQMTQGTNAELGDRIIKGIFSDANKEFKTYKSID